MRGEVDLAAELAPRSPARSWPSRAPTARPPSPTCSPRCSRRRVCRAWRPATSGARSSTPSTTHRRASSWPRSSSFQLTTTTEAFRPDVAILNLADDHLDWHGSFEAYAAGQGAHLRRTRGPTTSSCQRRRPRALRAGGRPPGRCSPSPSSTARRPASACGDGCDRRRRRRHRARRRPALPGAPHDLANALAAAAAALEVGATPGGSVRAARLRRPRTGPLVGDDRPASATSTTPRRPTRTRRSPRSRLRPVSCSSPVGATRARPVGPAAARAHVRAVVAIGEPRRGRGRSPDGAGHAAVDAWRCAPRRTPAGRRRAALARVRVVRLVPVATASAATTSRRGRALPGCRDGVEPGHGQPLRPSARPPRRRRRPPNVRSCWSRSSAVLNVVGVVMVLSASSVASLTDYGSAWYFFDRQRHVGIRSAAVAFVVAYRIDYRRWRKCVRPLLVVSAVLLRGRAAPRHRGHGRRVAPVARAGRCASSRARSPSSRSWCSGPTSCTPRRDAGRLARRPPARPGGLVTARGARDPRARPRLDGGARGSHRRRAGRRRVIARSTSVTVAGIAVVSGRCWRSPSRTGGHVLHVPGPVRPTRRTRRTRSRSRSSRSAAAGGPASASAPERQVELPPERAHRLHLRDHRRGARPHRVHPRAGLVRRLRRARDPHRLAAPDRFGMLLAAGVTRGSSARPHQHRCRRRPAAGVGHPAPVRVVRRLALVFTMVAPACSRTSRRAADAPQRRERRIR